VKDVQHTAEWRSKGNALTVRNIDLNLFRVFEAVMQHRSVSGASRQLAVTPSAVSHALARLRHALGDELFVSGESGMVPTARALQLAPGIGDGLGRINDAVSSSAFVPPLAHRTFRIAATDYSAVVVLPRMVARIAATAPQLNLRVFPANRADVVRQLDDARIDLFIGWFADLPERVNRARLLADSEAMVVRAGHPLAAGAVTKERLFAFPHVVVDLTGSESQADDGFFDERGVWRRIWIERLLLEMTDDGAGLVGRVAVTVPHFAAVAPLLLISDMVATLPRRLALHAAEHSGLVMLELPYEPATVIVEMIWHRRGDQDAGLRWLVGELAEGMAEADAPTG
jgi:DNA-binding transcriptional LysR family regulator